MKFCNLASIAAACFLGHCRPSDGCSPGATRCSGNVAELCDADRAYHDFIDCDQVSQQSGEAFSCALVRESTEDGDVVGHTCIPTEDAGSAGGGPE